MKEARREDELFVRLKQKILSEAAETLTTDSEISRSIDTALEAEGLSLSAKLRLRNRLFNSLRKLDVLQELLDDRSITEIMINSFDEIFVEKDGSLMRWEMSMESPEKLMDIIQQIVGRVNRRVNTSVPIADARLSDGSRVHIVLPPIALKGPTITIRKFPETIGMDRMVATGTISPEAALLMKELVRSGYNIFISGGTSSGKSTFLNALSEYIPGDERVITIEDSAELRIRQVRNLVSLETRDANSEGKGAISMSDLIRASLRMRPDRIIVGEVRGAEALDMLSAMNTGHDGSLSTGHANSVEDMLIRLETMVLMGAELPVGAIRQQIAAGIDIMVHLSRMRDKSRRVTEISELMGASEDGIRVHRLFSYDFEAGRLVEVGKLEGRAKLERNKGGHR